MTTPAKPVDAAAAADAAFARIEGQPFPQDIFTAPELRWAVVGVGVVAHQMAKSLALDGRKLYGVWNRTESKAEAFAEKYGVEHVYGTFDELVADPDVDAVYIATPHNTHINYLRKALPAGKHVLCEKAITLNSDELAEARKLAADNGVQLMEANTILHMPLYKELRRRADSGEFGPMALASVEFGSFREYGDYKARFYNRNLAGGAMLDIGVYAITYARQFMASQPDEVVSLANLTPSGVDGTSGFVMRNPDAQIATFTLSLHAKQPKRGVISFERCYLETMGYPRADHASIVWTDDGHTEDVDVGCEGYALCYEVADLERAAAGDAEAQSSIQITSDVMDLMTGLRREWGVVYPEEE